jgi:hypothetical protein
MDYYPIPDNAARQFIDSSTVFGEYCRARAAARQYQGGMYWKKQDSYCYLVKTMPDNRQRRIGPRSPDTEAVYKEFVTRKTETEARLASLAGSLRDSERLNKALKVGRVPTVVISVLQAIEEAGLAEYFTVVGTHALYAYESAAGVRIVQSALATQDVDLLWDARRKVQFMADMTRLGTSFLSILQKADPSFRRREDQLSTAINDKGFEIDFLRRVPQGDDPHPLRLTADEGDLWPVQARRANVLTDARRFEHIVVSATGRMALMRTIEPKVSQPVHQTGLSSSAGATLSRQLSYRPCWTKAC